MENKKERKNRAVHKIYEEDIKKNVEKTSYTNDEKFVLESFATRLNKELEEQNIKQEDFADTINISEGALSNYRNGTRFPQANTLFKMAKKLECSTDYLLGLSKLKSPDENFKTVHKLTGLSDKAIEVLRSELEFDKEARKSNSANSIFKDGINTISYLIENEQKYFFFKQMYNFLWFDSKNKDLIKRKEMVIDDNTGLSFSIDMLSSITKIEIDKTLYKLKEDIEV